MKKIVYCLIITAILVGCATNETQLKDTLKKNPDIVFDVIEENPEKFIEVVNRAAQKAQQQQYAKQMSEMKAEQEKDLKDPKKPKLSDDRRLIGNTNAKITIVEYADFQCPACRMAFDSLNQFKEKYKGKVQFYYKHMPLDFHKMALPASLYFEAVKLQDKSKAIKFYDSVFKNQKLMTDESFLKKMAQSVEADLKKLQQDIKSDKVKRIIESDMEEFQNFGFTGTPVILINGVALHGAQGLEELERIAKLTGGL
ncbi:MAG: DsbA family protein [Pseudobdellovibrionaceae bacterium]